MYKIYGLMQCNYCKNAALLLQARGLSYAYFALDDNEEMLEELKETHTWRTVPIIIYSIESDIFIGGYDNLRTHLQEQSNENNTV